MALAFVAKSAKFTASGATAVTSAALTTTSGNCIVLTNASWHSGAYTLTPSDSKTNTWAAGDRIQAAEASAEGRALAAASLNITGGAGHTGTVTSSLGSTEFEGNFIEFSGVATASATDKTASNTGGAGTTSLTVTSAATTQADELVIVCLSSNSNQTNNTFPDPPTGYTSIGVQQSNNTEGYQASYKIVSATGAQAVTWSMVSQSVGVVGVMLTLKAAVAAGTTVSPPQATHTYTGQVPKVQAQVKPAQATHTYTARSPQVRAQVKPAQVVHTYTGQAPQVRAQVKPAQATHSYTGRVPNVTAGGMVSAPVTTHVYTGQTPKVSAKVQPAQATHSYLGRVPTASAGTRVSPAPATHTYTARAPKLQARVQPSVATHTYTGRAPTITEGVVVVAVYGWGARGGVGSRQAGDQWQRIGSQTAQDTLDSIGSTTATAKTGKIWSDEA